MLGIKRLLVAAPQAAYTNVNRAVRDEFHLVPAFSLLQAVQSLRQGNVDAVLCCLHFDGWLMFEVFEQAKKLAPHLPLLASQLIPSKFNAQTIQKVAEEALAAGALAFIDYNAVLQRAGASEADKYLREELVRLLGDPGAA